MATSNVDTVDWRQARQWLIDSGVIPPTHRVTKPDITLIDFARSLRDGVFLCSLLNRLKTGCVEYTARPVMQHSYLFNINAFLNTCKSHFGIVDNDLFTDSELYDVDNFSKVMSALSKLSYTQEALSRGWKPFPSEDTRDYYNISGEDIYASLHDVSAQTAVYANIQDLYQDSFSEDDSFGYGDDKIYDSIVYYQQDRSSVKENDYDEIRKSVLQELYETEKSFLEVLRIIAKDYCEVLKDQMYSEDLKTLFSVAQKLLRCHESLKDGFCKCAEAKPTSGELDVAMYFFEVEEDLLEYGMYAAVLSEATEKAKILQNQKDVGRLLQSTMERSNQRFPLSDILPVPIQRMLRYPLLIKELEKNSRKSAMPSQNQVVQLEKLLVFLEDVAKYINMTKGDFETVRAIRELEANITEYKGPKLSTCGRYHMDGELKVRISDASGKEKEEPKSRWVFLFDKIIVITRRHYRIGAGVRYAVKAYHEVADLVVHPISSLRAKNFQHAFRIKVESKAIGSTEPVKEYVAFAKTDQLKFMWTEAIKKARDVISPRLGKKSHHTFELHNFDSPSKCNSCHRLLHGCYFQGYLCAECSVVSHRECLINQPSCTAVKHPRPPIQSIHTSLMQQNSVDSGLTRWAKQSNGTESLVGKRTYVATQRYNAFGPRRDTFLSFDKGDDIDILISVDPECWEGIHLKSGQRGKVSPHYLIRKAQLGPTPSLPIPVTPSSPDPSSPNTRRRDNMSEYSWYIGRKTRIDAEVALHRLRDGVFLIRESMDRPGEYAVALRWNNMPKHIKIMKNPQTDRIYVSDACDFGSMHELVEYYQKNSLGISFPGVDTTLKHSYLDVIEGRVTFDRRHHSLSAAGIPPPSFPAPVLHGQTPPIMSPPWSEGVWGEALCDFNGDGPGQLSFLKHDKVKVLSKETKKLGWWLGECNGKTGLFRADHIYIKETR